MFKGGVLFVDSADKAARFINLCDAFNVPPIFLADVPGFMVGSAVERQASSGTGAKMITAVSEATVPKFSVVVRKAYGAGLYAMAGPGSAPMPPSPCLPQRSPSWAPRLPSTPCMRTRSRPSSMRPNGRSSWQTGGQSTREDIDLLRLASELVIDAVVEPEDLRADLTSPGCGHQQGPRVLASAAWSATGLSRPSRARSPRAGPADRPTDLDAPSRERGGGTCPTRRGT